ncbi:hypothetical protein [Pseudoalteromonas ulvae]|uniref:Uncharacterized protein n=1 Tax=Pseudoalteromonas ulvae TaxID=107327 RepID=A0A244CVK1_PSEDV|nr:hypothetical protein [Pseudoalteromonas ulvae]OUL59279.1 hypothetical protein B1199_03140 [Pseudoalteromonas ulvae]
MWFVITIKSPVKFYNPDGNPIDVDGVEWTNEIVNEKNDVAIRIASNEAFIKDHQQAMDILSKTQIKGFKTKIEARDFGKTLPNGKWKYLKIISKG